MRRSTPLTGDGSQFDAPLDHHDSGRLLTVQTGSASADGRAFGAAAGLMVGLFIGFAGGFMVGQRGDPLPVPQSAAEAPVPAQAQVFAPQTYTESPVAEAPAARPSAPPVEQAPAKPAEKPARVPQATSPNNTRAPVAQAPSGLRDGRSGSLQVVSRPSGAQVYIDDVRVGTTPVIVSSVSADTHRVRLDLPGHRRWATSVDVQSGARARVGASLEK